MDKYHSAIGFNEPLAAAVSVYQDANEFKLEGSKKLQSANEHPVGNAQEGRQLVVLENAIRAIFLS
jgi:hypothetical protein